MSEDEPILEELEIDSTKLSVKEKFARAIVSESPRCPECSRILKDRKIEQCDYCGFDFAHLESEFPLDGLPELLQLHDFSNTLSDAELDEISIYQSVVKERYPQFSLKICVLPLHKDVKLHGMALWMLNQCPVPKDQSIDDKEWTALILTDSVTFKSAICTGYKVDVFLPAENAIKIVSNLNNSLRKGIHSKPYFEVIDSVITILDESKHGIKSQFKKFKQKH